MPQRIICIILILIFACSNLAPVPPVYAQNLLGLPEPGAMVLLSRTYAPALIKGLTVHQDNPFLFDFIIDTGNSHLKDQELKKESDRLIKYFFAALTIPEKDLWVNLSPYEKTRMVPDSLGKTAMGRDLLAQDYMLKQIMASLIYPEKDLGKKFWDKVYAQAQEKFGTVQIPVNTFNKVWIVADKASVYEHNQTAFVVSGHLKVMLEEDYLATQKHANNSVILSGTKDLNRIKYIRDSSASPQNDGRSVTSQIIREIILPALEKEVNEGANFATLRQIFYSQILATWFKHNLKEALLSQVYADKSTVNGVNLKDPSIKERIYQRYLQAYKKGAFNFIKEETIDNQSIPRKYFSGGYTVNPSMLTQATAADASMAAEGLSDVIDVKALLHTDPSQTASVDKAALSDAQLEAALTLAGLQGPAWDRTKADSRMLTDIRKLKSGEKGKTKDLKGDSSDIEKQKRNILRLLGDDPVNFNLQRLKGVYPGDIVRDFKEFFLSNRIFENASVKKQIAEQWDNPEVQKRIAGILKASLKELIENFMQAALALDGDYEIGAIQSADGVHFTFEVQDAHKDKKIVQVERLTGTMQLISQGMNFQKWMDTEREGKDVNAMFFRLAAFMKIQEGLLRVNKIKADLKAGDLETSAQGELYLKSDEGVVNHNPDKDLEFKSDFILAMINFLLGKTYQNLDDAAWTDAESAVEGMGLAQDPRLKEWVDFLKSSENDLEEDSKSFLAKASEKLQGLTPSSYRHRQMDSINLGYLQKDFESMVLPLLSQYKQLENLTEMQWANFRNKFIAESRFRWGSQMVNDSFVELVNHFISAEQMKKFYGGYGHLTTKDIIKVLQNLHTVSIDLPEYGTQLEVLKKYNIVGFGDTFRFSYALYADVLTHMNVRGERWIDVQADPKLSAELKAGRVTGQHLNTLAEFKAVTEFFGINPDNYRQVFRNMVTVLFREKGKESADQQEIDQADIEKMAEMVYGLFFFDLTHIYREFVYLANGTDLQKRLINIRLESLIYRGNDFYLMKAKRQGKDVLVKINYFSKHYDFEKYGKSITRSAIMAEVKPVFPLKKEDIFTAENKEKTFRFVIEILEPAGETLYSQMIQNEAMPEKRLAWAGQYVDLNARLFSLGTPSTRKVNGELDSSQNRNWLGDRENTTNVIVAGSGMYFDAYQDLRPYVAGKKEEYTRNLVRTLTHILFRNALRYYDTREEYESIKDGEWATMRQLAQADYPAHPEIIEGVISFLEKALNEKWGLDVFFKNWSEEEMSKKITEALSARNAAMKIEGDKIIFSNGKAFSVVFASRFVQEMLVKLTLQKFFYVKDSENRLETRKEITLAKRVGLVEDYPDKRDLALSIQDELKDQSRLMSVPNDFVIIEADEKTVIDYLKALELALLEQRVKLRAETKLDNASDFIHQSPEAIRSLAGNERIAYSSKLDVPENDPSVVYFEFMYNKLLETVGKLRILLESVYSIQDMDYYPRMLNIQNQISSIKEDNAFLLKGRLFIEDGLYMETVLRNLEKALRIRKQAFEEAQRYPEASGRTMMTFFVMLGTIPRSIPNRITPYYDDLIRNGILIESVRGAAHPTPRARNISSFGLGRLSSVSTATREFIVETLNRMPAEQVVPTINDIWDSLPQLLPNIAALLLGDDAQARIQMTAILEQQGLRLFMSSHIKYLRIMAASRLVGEGWKGEADHISLDERQRILAAVGLKAPDAAMNNRNFRKNWNAKGGRKRQSLDVASRTLMRIRNGEYDEAKVRGMIQHALEIEDGKSARQLQGALRDWRKSDRARGTDQSDNKAMVNEPVLTFLGVDNAHSQSVSGLMSSNGQLMIRVKEKNRRQKVYTLKIKPRRSILREFLESDADELYYIPNPRQVPKYAQQEVHNERWSFALQVKQGRKTTDILPVESHIENKHKEVSFDLGQVLLKFSPSNDSDGLIMFGIEAKKDRHYSWVAHNFQINEQVVESLPEPKISEIRLANGDHIQIWVDPQTANAAMDVNGGIDLKSLDAGMRVVKDALGGVTIAVDPAMIARVRQEGVWKATPVIIQMTHVASILPLLGLQQQASH